MNILDTEKQIMKEVIKTLEYCGNICKEYKNEKAADHILNAMFAVNSNLYSKELEDSTKMQVIKDFEESGESDV